MDIDDAKQWLLAFAMQTPEHAILMLDRTFVVRWANPAAGEIFATPVAAMVGRELHRFFTPDDVDLGIPEHEIAVAASQGSSEDDRWMRRADDALFWASGRTIALTSPHGVFGFLKILRNETTLKMRMETFSNHVAALEQTESEKLAAIATLSHELRNPLSALAMAATALQRNPTAAQRAQMVDIIQRNVGFIARMADDLEQAMRASVGKLTLQVEALDLREELDRAVRTAMARAGHPPRTLEILLPPGAPIVFDGDRARIQQILVNLIGNAIKFTDPQGRIWIKGTIEGRYVVVRVEDDGAGIVPDMLHYIFRMFTQAERADGRSTGSAGLGIGLALVRQIVERHGGSVQARSDGPGKGAQFTVRLPLTQTTAAV